MALDIIEESEEKNAWSTKKCIVVAIISLVVGSAIFLLAYICMNQNIGIGALNQPILSFIVQHRDPIITNIMKIVSTITNPIPFAVIVLMVASIWAISKREIWRPLLLAVAMGVTLIATLTIKTYFMTGRPSQTDMIAPYELDYSFPSGHTLGIAVFILVLGYLIYSRHSSALRIFDWFSMAIVGIGIVAVSRLYLGYHWLTDITASIGIGFIILAISILIDRIVVSRSEN